MSIRIDYNCEKKYRLFDTLFRETLRPSVRTTEEL